MTADPKEALERVKTATPWMDHNQAGMVVTVLASDRDTLLADHARLVGEVERLKTQRDDALEIAQNFTQVERFTGMKTRAEAAEAKAFEYQLIAGREQEQRMRAEARLAALTEAASFLQSRLLDFELRVDQEGAPREFYGHVTPALHRLSDLLKEAALASPQAGVEDNADALKCRTCGAPATALAKAVQKDGGIQDWPVCNNHFMAAVMAGWKPAAVQPSPLEREQRRERIARIIETHIMSICSDGNVDPRRVSKPLAEAIINEMESGN